jgi:hypothetical protein
MVLAGVIFLVFVTVSSSIVSGAEAQNRTSFATSDRFVIPEFNGSIRFAYNGSYLRLCWRITLGSLAI